MISKIGWRLARRALGPRLRHARQRRRGSTMLSRSMSAAPRHLDVRCAQRERALPSCNAIGLPLRPRGDAHRRSRDFPRPEFTSLRPMIGAETAREPALRPAHNAALPPRPVAAIEPATSGSRLDLFPPKSLMKCLNMTNLPNKEFSVRETFGIDSDMKVKGYAEADPHVPPVDPDYLFDRNTTLAILAGFAFNRRVMVQGYHGTGKSTHIEQVAARLNWPLVRVNLDAHVSPYRSRRQGRDRLKDGKQITEFRDGILPWAVQNNIALVFDEYDAGRPDVMFVIQRVLEVAGPADAARPEPRHHPAPGLPAVLDHQHHRSRRYVGPLSRHPADQPGPDGPLVDRRRRSTICRTTRKSASSSPRPRPTRPRRARSSSPTWCGSPISPARPSSTATSRP